MNNVEKTLKLIEDSINKKCNGLECKVVKNNVDLRLENIQLKKQIDLMAEYINYLSDELVKETGKNELQFCDMGRCLDDGDIDCKDCIKQYFEKQAKEKGE